MAAGIVRRQQRSAILAALAEHGPQSVKQLAAALGSNTLVARDVVFELQADDLVQEGRPVGRTATFALTPMGVRRAPAVEEGAHRA